MRFYTTERLGPNRSLTPEGYLLIKDVPLARTGTQVYGPGEVPVEPGPDGRILIERDPEEVFRPETVASFNLKPLVNDHPTEDVVPGNWRDLAIGVVHDPRRGEGLMDDFMVGDVLVTCPDAIEAIKANRLREISCGYDADYTQTGPGRGKQHNIIGNHVALVEAGRCGPRCAIGDTVRKDPGDLRLSRGLTVVDGKYRDVTHRMHRQRHIHIHL